MSFSHELSRTDLPKNLPLPTGEVENLHFPRPDHVAILISCPHRDECLAVFVQFHRNESLQDLELFIIKLQLAYGEARSYLLLA